MFVGDVEQNKNIIQTVGLRDYENNIENANN